MKIYTFLLIFSRLGVAEITRFLPKLGQILTKKLDLGICRYSEVQKLSGYKLSAFCKNFPDFLKIRFWPRVKNFPHFFLAESKLKTFRVFE